MNHARATILAFIPCFNEAASIAALLEEFRRLPFTIDTLVIDDGSTDDTAKAAVPYATIIRHDTNRGLTAAILTSIAYARDHGYDYCLQIDGDGQHIPSEIQHLIDRLATAPSNLLIGSRYYGRTHPIAENPRRFAGTLISVVMFGLFNRWICDPLSGMRMLDRTAIDYYLHQLRPTQPDNAMIPMALRQGLSVKEVRVQMRPRMHGTSSLNGLRGLKLLVRLVMDILRIRFGRG